MKSAFPRLSMAIVALACLVSGCGKPAAPAAPPSPPATATAAPDDQAWRRTAQHLLLNNGAEPQSLDPALITGVPEARLVDALFEGLTTLDPVDLQPRPGVAERWTISDDGLVYTFFLRRDARWTDGRPVTAEDFVGSWKRALTPATGAAYAYQLFPIRQAEAFHRGEVSFDQVGVAAVDDHQLRVTLGQPCSYFLTLAAFHTLFPVPLAIVEKHGDRWVRPENLVGNGAFRLVSWDPRHSIELVRSDTYWERDAVRLERISVFPYDDLNTSLLLFRQGKLHWMDGVPLEKIDELRRDPAYYVAPYLGSYFYRLNVTKPPFDDARVRRAFSMAIDRQAIAEQVLRAGQQPAAWFCPPVAGYEPVSGLPYDPAKARELVREAGYGPGGKPWPTIEILYNTSEAHKQAASFIADQWKATFGATVSLRNAEWKIYLSEMDNLNYQIARASWIGDYSDPNTFFDLFITKGGNNRTGWSQPRYDALLTKAQAERDPAARNAIYREMETILVEDECPIIPLYMYVTQGMLSQKVQGWHMNIRDFHPWKHVWLEE